MPALFEEIKPVVLVKYEFEYREILKFQVFLEISDYQDTDARKNNNDFLVEYSSISAVFSIELLMEEIDLAVAQN